DPLPVSGAGPVPTCRGRRVKRGLYRAADGTPINADVNGAYNILRKVAPEAFTQGSRGCVVHPVRLAAYTHQQFASDWEQERGVDRWTLAPLDFADLHTLDRRPTR